MEKKNEQYVIYPHNGNSEPMNGLTPQDKLIYLAIRRYMNRDTMESFPSYARITQDIGAAAKTIKKSVDNLVREEYLQTRRDGKKIIYKFNNKKQFEPFSWDFLDKPDLTFTEKSYIVAAQQYMFKDNEEGKISYKNNELSKLINMTEATISRCNHSLEKKGYLEGASELVKKFQLRELDQLFIWKFKEQGEKIEKNTEDIREIKKKLELLIAENEKLKEKIRISNTYILTSLKEQKNYEYHKNGLNISTQFTNDGFTVTCDYSDIFSNEKDEFEKYVENLDGNLYEAVIESLGADKVKVITNCLASSNIETVRSAISLFKNTVKRTAKEMIVSHEAEIKNLKQYV